MKKHAYWRCWAATVAVAVLAACAPVRETFYKPIGPGQRHSVGVCGGPPTQLSFEVENGLGITVSAWKYDAERVSSIWIEFFVGDGKVLKLAGTAPFITTVVDQALRTFNVGEISYVDIIDDGMPNTRQQHHLLAATDKMKGAMLPSEQRWIFNSQFQNNRSFLVKIDVGGLFAKYFVLHLPDATLNGRPIQFPDIQFEYREEYYWVAWMC